MATSFVLLTLGLDYQPKLKWDPRFDNVSTNKFYNWFLLTGSEKLKAGLRLGLWGKLWHLNIMGERKERTPLESCLEITVLKLLVSKFYACNCLLTGILTIKVIKREPDYFIDRKEKNVDSTEEEKDCCK